MALRVSSVAWAMLLVLTGCTHWAPYSVPPTPGPALPSSLRVWSPDTGATVLAQPFVRGDTLYGRVRGDTLGIALRSIQRLERPRLDGALTAAVVVGGVAGWIAMGFLGGGWE